MPASGAQEAGDEAQQRGLAAAGRADADDELAGRDGERDVVHAGVAAGVAEADAFERDGRVALPSHLPRRSALRSAFAHATAARIARAAGHDAARDRRGEREQRAGSTVAAQAKPVAP